MRFLTIEYIKKHSRIITDAEDDILEIYGESAEEIIAGCLNRGDTVEEMVSSLVEQYGQVPWNILQAGLLLVDLSYMQRSPVNPQNMSVVPYTFDLLLKRYMIL